MASSAVSLPISNASFRLVVVWMGVRSSGCTNAGACIPLRLNFTRNLVFFIGGLVDQLYSDNGEYWRISFVKALMGRKLPKSWAGNECNRGLSLITALGRCAESLNRTTLLSEWPAQVSN